MNKIMQLDWSKTAKQFSVNSYGRQASRRVGKQASKYLTSGFPFSDF